MNEDTRLPQSVSEKQTILQLSDVKLQSMNVSRMWAEKNSCLSKLMQNYSPANWHYLSQIGDKVYLRECAALGALNTLYDNAGAAQSWLEIQITGMFLSSASDNEVLTEGIRLFVDNFTAIASSYKLTELMLFFSRYKAGRYDNSYVSFDPRRIGLAFNKEFLPERNRAIARIEALQNTTNAGKDWYDPAKNGGRSSLEHYRNNDIFDTEIIIRRDSQNLRQELNIVGSVSVNGRCVSRLPKNKLMRITKYKENGSILVI